MDDQQRVLCNFCRQNFLLMRSLPNLCDDILRSGVIKLVYWNLGFGEGGPIAGLCVGEVFWLVGMALRERRREDARDTSHVDFGKRDARREQVKEWTANDGEQYPFLTLHYFYSSLSDGSYFHLDLFSYSRYFLLEHFFSSGLNI